MLIRIYREEEDFVLSMDVTPVKELKISEMENMTVREEEGTITFSARIREGEV